MQKILLQPVGDSDAQRHYVDTIEHPVSIERIAKHVEDKTLLEQLREAHKDSLVPVWGVTPGAKNINKGKWDRVSPGDVVLFSRSNKIIASATVARTIHNRDLALDLWKTNADGETWEYIYFLDEVRPRDITYEQFNIAAGYQAGYIIRGFNVLDEEKSQGVIDHFGLGSDVYLPEVTQTEFETAVEYKPEGDLDKKASSITRREQPFLRGYLFRGKKFGECGICGRRYPVTLLVAAHIKKRAICSIAERLDYKHIVMPMCQFGCDDLFEKGYITVDESKVVLLPRADTTEHLAAYLATIVGRTCSYWNEQTAVYFKWHKENNSAVK